MHAALIGAKIADAGLSGLSWEVDAHKKLRAEVWSSLSFLISV